MRLLHTSDWHLGQNFMGKSREAEHRSFIGWLLEEIESQSVDALVIAGDIFDTGTPPSYARKLYNDFIVSLRETGCRDVVILGGNHDSVATLEESRELLAYLNVIVVGGVAERGEDQVVVLNRRDNQPGAVLCAIPFVRPRDVVVSQSGESQQDKQRALQTGIVEHYADIHTLACQRRDAVATENPLPIIATGHLTTVGGTSSESVRDIYIGTLDAFPAECFPAANYIALGHLHKPQKVGGKDHIRYSGSPLPLSFDEAPTTKQVLLVDFDEGQLQRVEPLEVPRFQQLQCLKGSLSELEEQLGKLDDPEDGQTLWLEVVVRQDDYLSDITQRIEEMVEGRPIEVLRVRRDRSGKRTQIERQAKETLAELNVEEVFTRRLSQEDLNDELKVSLEEAFSQIVADLAQGGGEGLNTGENKEVVA